MSIYLTFTSIFYLLFSIFVLLFIEINRRVLILSVLITLFVALFFHFFSKSSGWSWFDWAKRYLVCIPIFLFALSEFSNSYNKKITKNFSKYIGTYLMPFIFFLNMTVTVMYDFLGKYLFNGVIGILLILTIPRFWKGWYFDDKNILGFGSDSLDWILLYSIWSVAFIYNHAGHGISHMFIPFILILLLSLLYCFIYQKWHWWICARAYSIYLTLFSDSFFPTLFPKVFPSHPSVHIQLIIGFISLIISESLNIPSSPMIKMSLE